MPIVNMIEIEQPANTVLFSINSVLSHLLNGTGYTSDIFLA